MRPAAGVSPVCRSTARRHHSPNSAGEWRPRAETAGLETAGSQLPRVRFVLSLCLLAKHADPDLRAAPAAERALAVERDRPEAVGAPAALRALGVEADLAGADHVALDGVDLRHHRPARA